MEKYLGYDSASLEEMLAACSEFKERQNIRGALRELKGVKLEGTNIVTYSFGPKTVRHLSSIKSPNSDNKKLLPWQQNVINSEHNKHQTSGYPQNKNSELKRNEKVQVNGLKETTQEINVNNLKNPKYRSYYYAGNLSSPTVEKAEKDEENNNLVRKVSDNTHNSAKQDESVKKVVSKYETKSGINRPSSLVLAHSNKSDSVTSDSPRSSRTPSPRKPRRISYRTSPFSPTSSQLSPISSTVSRSRLGSEPARSESGTVSKHIKPVCQSSQHSKQEPKRSHSVQECSVICSSQKSKNSPLEDSERLKTLLSGTGSESDVKNKPPLGSIRLKRKKHKHHSASETDAKVTVQTLPLNDFVGVGNRLNRNSGSEAETEFKTEVKNCDTYVTDTMKSETIRSNLNECNITLSVQNINEQQLNGVGKIELDKRPKSYGSYIEDIANISSEKENDAKRRTKSDGSFIENNENEQQHCDKNIQKKKSSLTRKHRVDSESPRILRKFRSKSKDDDSFDDSKSVSISDRTVKSDIQTPREMQNGIQTPAEIITETSREVKSEIKNSRDGKSEVKTPRNVNGETQTPRTTNHSNSVRRKLPDIPMLTVNVNEDDETIHERTLRLLQERKMVRREKLEQEKLAESKAKEDTEEIKKSLEEKLERSDSKKKKAYRVRRELQLLNRENELKSPRPVSLSETLEEIKSRKKLSFEKECVRKPVQRSQSDNVGTSMGRNNPDCDSAEIRYFKSSILDKIPDNLADQPLSPEVKIDLIGSLMQEEAKLQEMLRKSTNFSEKRQMRAEVRKLREKRIAIEGPADGPVQSSYLKRSASVTAGVITPAGLPVKFRTTPAATKGDKPSIEELRKQLSETSDYDEKRKIRLALRQLRQSRDGGAIQPGLQRSQSVSLIPQYSSQPVCNGDTQSNGPLVTRSQSVTDKLTTNGENIDSNLNSKSAASSVTADVFDNQSFRKSDNSNCDKQKIKHSTSSWTGSKPPLSLNVKTRKQSNSNSFDKEFRRRSTSDILNNTNSNNTVNHFSNGDVKLRKPEAGSPPPIVKRNSLVDEEIVVAQSFGELSNTKGSTFIDTKSVKSGSILDNQNTKDSKEFNDVIETENKKDVNEPKVRSKPSNILISRGDINKNKTGNKLQDANKELAIKSPEDISSDSFKSFKSEFKFRRRSESSKDNLISESKKHDNSARRLSKELIWLEDKKKTIPTPNELDKLMSSMDIEAAFSQILDAVETFPDTNGVSEPPTPEVVIMEEDSSESSVESSDVFSENKSSPNDNEDKYVSNVLENGLNNVTLTENINKNITNNCNDTNKLSELDNTEFNGIVPHSNNEINGLKETSEDDSNNNESAIKSDDGLKTSEAQIQLRPNFYLDTMSTDQPATNGAISVIHGDDGTVTVQEVNKIQDGDTTITEWKKIRRSHSKTETRETDTVIEKKITSPGGESSVYEKDVSKTKRKLTSRGSDYFSRNHYNIRRTKDKEGAEIVEHQLSSESENVSVSKNESWGDKSEANVVLNRDGNHLKESQGHTKRQSAMMENVDEKLEATISEDVEGTPEEKPKLETTKKSLVRTTSSLGLGEDHTKLVEAHLGRPTGCPEVTSPLEETSALEGSTVAMECFVQCCPLPSIQWYKGDNLIIEDDRVTAHFNRIEGKAWLEIENAEHTDVGEYKCHFENNLGTASTTGKLNVKRKTINLPSFISDLEDVTICENQGLVLECKVADADGVSWYKDGIIQRHSSDFKQTFDGTVAKFEIVEIFLDDSGTYTCALRNEHGDKKCSCTVTVTEPESQNDVVPVFLRKPETQIVDEQGMVIIECDVIGSPEPVISWSCDRSKVVEDDRHKMSYDGRVARYIIKRVIVQDGGKIECTAENTSGRVCADCLLVVNVVKNPPVVTSPLSNCTFPSGKSAILECQIEGEPKPEIVWRKNGRIIGHMLDFKQTYVDDVARLEIKNVCAQDSGCYECVATNEHGDITTSCLLNITDEAKKEEPKSTPDKVSRKEAVVSKPTVVEPIVTPKATVQEEKVQTATVKKFPNRFVPKLEDDQIAASKSHASKVMLVRNASLRSMNTEGPRKPVVKRSGSFQSRTTAVSQKDNAEMSVKNIEDTTSVPKVEKVKSDTEHVPVIMSSPKADSGAVAKHSEKSELKSPIKTLPEKVKTEEKVQLNLDLNKNYTKDLNSNIEKFTPVEDVKTSSPKSYTDTPEKVSDKDVCSAVNEEQKVAKPLARFRVGGEIRRSQSVRTPGSEKPEWLQVKLRRVGGSKTPVLDKEKPLSALDRPKSAFEKSPDKTVDISPKTDQEMPKSVHKDVKLSRSQSARIVDKVSSPALKDSTNSLINKPNRDSVKLTPVSERAKIFQMNDSKSPSGKSSPTEIITKALNLNRAESMRAPIGTRSFTVQRSHSFKTTPPSSQGDVTLDLSPQKDQSVEDKVSPRPGVVKLWDPSAPTSNKMDYNTITDEEQLSKMLSSSDNFDERKKIRARIKELRDIHMKEWEAKRVAREKDSEDMIKKRHREADAEKQKKLDAFKEQASHHTESKHLAVAEQHLREKHKQADINKQKQMDAFDRMAGKEDGKTTTTTRRVETVTRVGGGGAYGKPAEDIAPELAQQILKAVSPSISGVLNVKTESWNSRDGVTRTSEKTESWGGKPMNPFKQADAKAKTNQLGAPGGATKVNMTRSPSAIKTMLLEWTKAMTREYIDTIEITNFSTSWNDGMAFCALIHHFYPEAFNFKELNPKNRRKNFDLAFDTAEKYADIAPLLDTEDMVRMKKPDWKCVFTYVQSFYRKLRDHDNNKA